MPHELGQFEYAHDAEYTENLDDSDHTLALSGVRLCVGRVSITQLPVDRQFGKLEIIPNALVEIETKKNLSKKSCSFSKN